MSTLNIAIAQDVESSKDSEVVISNVNFDSSEPSTIEYWKESKQIADILTKFSESIPKEDFKADILLTKYHSNLESLKDELSLVLSSVSEKVYDLLTQEFKFNLRQVDKSELTQIVLSDYKRILDESKPKEASESRELKTDESDEEFRTVEVETDSDFNNLEAAENTKSDSAYYTFHPSTSETDSSNNKFKNSESKIDSVSDDFEHSDLKSDSSLDSFEDSDSKLDSASENFKYSDSKIESFSDSFDKTDSSKDYSSMEFKTVEEVLDENVLSFDTSDFNFDYSESKTSIKNQPLNEQIQMGWDKLLDETKDNLPFKGASKRFQENTANPEAWTRVANDMAMSVTSSVFNAGVKLVNSVDGKTLQVITDLPGYLSSVVNQSLINPTKSFIHEVSSSVADMIRDVVDAPAEIANLAIGKFTDMYSSFLGGISGKVTNFNNNVSSKIDNWISGLFDKSKLVIEFKNYRYEHAGTLVAFSTKKFNSEYGSQNYLPDSKNANLEYGSLNEFSPQSQNLEYNELYEVSLSSENSKSDYTELSEFSSRNFNQNYKSDVGVSLGKLNSSAPKRGDFRTSSLEFLSDAFWDIKITPHKFTENSISPPDILKYYDSKRLPIISFDLSGEMIDNSDFELYNSFMTSYPSMYSRMNRLTISLPEMVRTVDGKLTSSLRKFKEDYILYVTGKKLSPSFRDFRYCAYEIEVTKFTQSWSLIKTWKLLGIPEFNNSTRGGSDSSIEIGEISFNIVGEDLKSNEEAKQNEKSAYDTLLDERNARNGREE